ncbi:MAG: 50S ribosomal protein L11 methyltransferase [Mariprofundaceae bacterium]|nr:50S ribosomal protein L11 methyltransferase [Mariprofundaceae bacterium]
MSGWSFGYPRQASRLDMGAGSGILAIAAAKLGVKHVLAVDIRRLWCMIYFIYTH